MVTELFFLVLFILFRLIKRKQKMQSDFKRKRTIVSPTEVKGELVEQVLQYKYCEVKIDHLKFSNLIIVFEPHIHSSVRSSVQVRSVCVSVCLCLQC